MLIKHLYSFLYAEHAHVKLNPISAKKKIISTLNYNMKYKIIKKNFRLSV